MLEPEGRKFKRFRFRNTRKSEIVEYLRVTTVFDAISRLGRRYTERLLPGVSEPLVLLIKR